MHKRSITYTDFEDEEVTEELYFNISKTELLRLEAEHNMGFDKYLEGLIKEKDTKVLMKEFEGIILSAYGRNFVKSDEIKENFRNSAAYDALFMELFDAEKMAEFLAAAVPKEVREAALAERQKREKNEEMQKKQETETPDVAEYKEISSGPPVPPKS